MTILFANRTQAGLLLAEKLQRYGGKTDAVVLGIARGGLPVAAVVAEALDLPLDVLVVRKLGLPGAPEAAMGAIGPAGVQILDTDVIRRFNVSAFEIDEIRVRERRELARREKLYRNGGAVDLSGKTAIIVDDGIATGATAKAAACSAHRSGARALVIAAPVMSSKAFALLRTCSDHVAAVSVNDHFVAVGSCYQDFSEVDDDEVIAILGRGQIPRSGRQPPVSASGA
jgi:putative phosphoribosyl transferase